ncbi:MAG: hypothetical protein DI536_32200 [Archangium gephyra]|uniref:Outer membrane protein beta-barrel domain-containing protein n=1 Tax=Archangium gephyra TaxID=48 RepID=A0A2W5SV75_9BACT|nr:MAG: hypothetical protein DI536_32200 [Archangium gephyra]
MTLMIAAVLAATPALADGEASEVRQSGGLLDASAHRRPMMISLFAGVPHAYWYYAGFPFGVGGRFLIPLAHDGFIPRVNDEFDIEFGVDFLGVAPRGAFYGVFAIPVEVMWRFHMVDRLSLYAKLGAAIEFGVSGYYCYYGACRTGVGVGAQPIGNVGLIFMATKTIALRLEAGYPWVKAGIGFAF